MPGSIAVPVRKALTTALQNEYDNHGDFTDAESVKVTYAYDWSDTAQRNSVFTGRVIAPHEPAGLKSGRLFRNETADFELVIQVHGVGLSADETDEKAIAIGTVAEEFIADHKNNELGVDGLHTIRVASMELVSRGNADGSISELVYTIRYTARLT